MIKKVNDLKLIAKEIVRPITTKKVYQAKTLITVAN